MASQRPTHRLNALFLFAMGIVYRAATPSFNRAAPSSRCPPPPPPPLILSAFLSLRHRQAFICPSCARSRFLSLLQADPVFHSEQARRFGFRGETHTHAALGGRDWFGKPAKYFIHGHAICLWSLIPIWCYLLSLAAEVFFFTYFISHQVISSVHQVILLSFPAHWLGGV